MKQVLFAILLIFMISITTHAKEIKETGFDGRPITQNVWMQSGYTLNQGEFMIGLGPIAYGITDNIQLETNVLLFLFQIYNVNGKVSIIKDKDMALAVGLEYLHFNLSSLLSTDNDEDELKFDAISPFISYTTNLGESLKLHVGAKYSIFTGDAKIEDSKTSSSVNGTTVSGGLEYSISKKTKFLGEVAYDVTFKGVMAGGAVLFGWETFRLKLGVGYYAPEKDSYTIPVIGLWWRFRG